MLMQTMTPSGHPLPIIAAASNWGSRIGGYLWSVVTTTLIELLVFLGPLLLLAAIMHQISRRLEIAGVRLFGAKVHLKWFRALGVAVHELGHAGMCVVFRHKIIKIKLFEPDPSTGVLGYVRHSFNPESVYQRVGNLFIGIGPVFSGGLVIYLALHVLLGNQVGTALTIPDASESTSSLVGMVSGLMGMTFSTALGLLSRLLSPSTILSWEFWVFLYIALTVGGNITLSKPDLDGARYGFQFLVGVLAVANALLLLFLDLPISSIIAAASRATSIYAILVLAIVVNSFTLILITGVQRILRK